MTSFEEEYDKTAQDYVKVGKTTKLVSAWTGELRDLQWDGTVSYDGPDEGDEMKGESRFGCVDTMATTKTCDMHTSMYGGCGKKLSACDFKMLMTMTDKMIIRDANDVLEVGGRVEMKMQTKIDPQTVPHSLPNSHLSHTHVCSFSGARFSFFALSFSVFPSLPRSVSLSLPLSLSPSLPRSLSPSLPRACPPSFSAPFCLSLPSLRSSLLNTSFFAPPVLGCCPGI